MRWPFYSPYRRRFFLNLPELIPRSPKSDEFYSGESAMESQCPYQIHDAHSRRREFVLTMINLFAILIP